MTAPDIRAWAREGPVHFVGIAGAGMRALAALVLRSGGDVTGCDLRPGGAGELGLPDGALHEGHDPAHVVGAAGVVVTAAVPGDHPEIEAARSRGIPVVGRARALAGIVNPGTVVGVAGTHGKTTTTAMTTEVLTAAGLDPTGFVGGRVPGWEGNLRAGRDDLFVVEADEYDRSFLTLEPDVAVVTTVEADHLDTYGSLEGVRRAFAAYLDRVPDEGRIIACADDHGASRLLAASGRRGYGYGLSAGAQLRGVPRGADGGAVRVDVVEEGRHRGVVSVGVPGLHNARNALAAAAAGRALGAEWEAIRAGLAGFRGVGRRFERLGEPGGIAVIDDYAHHPTEVRATLDAARRAHPDRRVVAVFQPHLYSRTRDFADAFGRALAVADAAWVTDVYPAREEPIPGVTGELVADAAREAGVAVTYHAGLEGLASALAGSLEEGDVCLTLGAGTIEAVGPALVEILEDAAAVGAGGGSGVGGSRG